LFQARGAELRPIFSGRVAWSNADRNANDALDGSAVVMVDRAEHGGHFDLVVKETVLRGPLDDSAAKRRKKVSSQRYVWTGA